MKFINAYDDPLLYDSENAVLCSDLKFWKDIISQYKPNSVLEIGCGTGRVAKEILSNIHEYSGIDLSEEFLNYFRKTSIVADLNLMVGDACDYNFNKTYDCIILPANFISHIQDDSKLEQLFANIKMHLSQDGKIIVDYYNPQIRFLDMQIKDQYCYSFTLDNSDIKVFETHYYDNLKQINNITRSYIVNDLIIKTIQLPMRIYFKQEVEYIIKKANLKICDVYGNYNFEPISEYCDKLIYVLSLT